MNFADITITKRDGKREDFSINKIKNAIARAFEASGFESGDKGVALTTMRVSECIGKNLIGVEEVQDLVEQELMHDYPVVAKKYILYRDQRTRERERKTEIKHIMDGIVAIDKNDVNLSNANMSSHTPAGQMMTFASEITKDYAYKYLLSPQFSEAHKQGDIHIHDLDYYPTKTTTCLQYDLHDLFERGFRTKNGSIRTPQSIRSYATLATIVFQTNQNEQHGGQSIPAFDFFMAPGVLKSYRKYLADCLCFALALEGKPVEAERIEQLIAAGITSIDQREQDLVVLTDRIERAGYELSALQLRTAAAQALDMTRKETHQAMEGFIHNLNTMHSRGGNQVVFSSVNYGTDTSAEGRMVIEELLLATMQGLGNKGEVPVFPIQIFKLKEGVSYSDADYKLAVSNFDAALAGELKFESPNFDLLLKACETTSCALFPNFMSLDTPFNRHESWRADDAQRYKYEPATMGCRTRVFENVNGDKTSLGRGNLSFTTINLPRLALLAKQEASRLLPGSDEESVREKAVSLFLEGVRQKAILAGKQLYARYEYQRSALACQFPFMMSNDVWKGGALLAADDRVEEVLKSGTLGIGFIGGHNAMVALFGEGHAHNDAAWDTLYKAVVQINEVAAEFKERYKLNYSVLATPAEGLSGRFTRLDKKRFGILKGVNDRDYYVNSFHVDVKEPVSILQKIKREAPFHAITGGGHITYVELDGEARKNVQAILKIVKVMHDEHIGYGSINHPVDSCRKCGFKGLIYSACPVCGSEDVLRMRRITGYLTGDLNSWNSAKRAEEKDRVKHA